MPALRRDALVIIFDHGLVYLEGTRIMNQDLQSFCFTHAEPEAQAVGPVHPIPPHCPQVVWVPPVAGALVVGEEGAEVVAGLDVAGWVVAG